MLGSACLVVGQEWGTTRQAPSFCDRTFLAQFLGRWPFDLALDPWPSGGSFAPTAPGATFSDRAHLLPAWLTCKAARDPGTSRSLRTALWDGGGGMGGATACHTCGPGSHVVTTPGPPWYLENLFAICGAKRGVGNSYSHQCRFLPCLQPSAPSPHQSFFLLVQKKKKKLTQQVVFLVFLFYTKPQFLNLKAKHLLILLISLSFGVGWPEKIQDIQLHLNFRSRRIFLL